MVLKVLLFALQLHKLCRSSGGGGGQVVSMLALYSYLPSSNPAEIISFYSLNRMKINVTENGDGLFLNSTYAQLTLCSST